ncbi:MAG: NADPH-dependent FMN reductase [Bdellovibrionales bacterium]
MKILFFAGSLRAQSFNKKYVRVAYDFISTLKDVEAEIIDLLAYPMPVFNQDIQDKAFPDSVTQLIEKIMKADAIVISSPEYNGSISSVLKNTVDWSSRGPKNPWAGKQVLLLGASPGALGAVRGLWHSRRPFEVLNAHVYPEMSGLPKAHEAFDEKGALKDKVSLERLTKLLQAFVDYAR